jgi:hypothetical protein
MAAAAVASVAVTSGQPQAAAASAHSDVKDVIDHLLARLPNPFPMIDIQVRWLPPLLIDVSRHVWLFAEPSLHVGVGRCGPSQCCRQRVPPSRP